MTLSMAEALGIDLADPAWLHEHRGPHGEWVRGPGEAVKLPPHAGHLSMVLPGMYAPRSPEQAQAALAEVQHGIDVQSKLVPGVTKNQTVELRVDVEGGGRNTLGVTLPPDNEIELSLLNTNAFSGGKADAEKVKDEKNGWWTPTDPQYSLADATVGHEIGHVLEADMDSRAWEDMWVPLAAKLGLPPPTAHTDPYTGVSVVTDPDAWVADHKAAITKLVSKYGASDHFEMIAELWREYSLNSHPRPAAQWLGDYIRAHLKPRWAAA